MLSRAPLPDKQPTMIETVDNLSFLPINGSRLDEIRAATDRDDTMSQLKRVIVKGWPEHKAELPAALTPYYNYRDEMTIQDGIVLRGDCVVIPTSMRSDIKKKLHAGHLGMNACQRRAREVVYWPGMSSEVREYIESCDICASLADKQAQEPLLMHEVPSRPWERVGTDLFTIAGRSYLLTVDYFSNFFEVDHMTDTTSDSVITKMKHHFARHGIPDTVISDGGPQYTSREFKMFSDKWGFEHITSSPGNSQSNGCAEAHVKIAKRMMRRCIMAKEDPYLGLLNLRNTPTEGMNSSPAQRLMGRQTKTTIPTTNAVLAPQIPAGQKELKEKIKLNIA